MNLVRNAHINSIKLEKMCVIDLYINLKNYKKASFSGFFCVFTF